MASIGFALLSATLYGSADFLAAWHRGDPQ
jgi:hypothetical protein